MLLKLHSKKTKCQNMLISKNNIVTVDSISDCFDDMESPKFGWRVKVELKQDEPCDLTTTCFQMNENSSGNNNVEGSAVYYKLRKRSYYSDWNHASSRQTGETFRSASPPDCRVRTC